MKLPMPPTCFFDQADPVQLAHQRSSPWFSSQATNTVPDLSMASDVPCESPSFESTRPNCHANAGVARAPTRKSDTAATTNGARFIREPPVGVDETGGQPPPSQLSRT